MINKGTDQYMPLPEDGVSKPLNNTRNLIISSSRSLGNAAMRNLSNLKHILHQDKNITPEPRSWLSSKAIADEQARQEEKKELQETASMAHQILAKSTAVFPFDLFPNSITLDRTKITIILKKFFMTEQIISIRIEDILNVSVSLGPLFGTVTISSRVMNSTDHFDVGFLRRKEALYIKQIIQGYVIAQHNNIKVSHLRKDELIKTLCEIGEHAT